MPRDRFVELLHQLLRNKKKPCKPKFAGYSEQRGVDEEHCDVSDSRKHNARRKSDDAYHS